MILAKKAQSVKQTTKDFNELIRTPQPTDFNENLSGKCRSITDVFALVTRLARRLIFPLAGKTSADYQRQPFDWIGARDVFSYQPQTWLTGNKNPGNQ